MSRSGNSGSNSTVPVRTLWLATRLVLDCFAARGYKHDIKRFQTTEALFHEYVDGLENNLKPLRIWATAPAAVGPTPGGRTRKRVQQVCACFMTDTQVNKKVAEQLGSEMKEAGVQRLVLLWTQPGSAPGIKFLQAQFNLETWTYAIAQSQFYRNAVVPVHRKLTAVERSAFFRRYKLDPAHMSSHMRTTTAMARFLGAECGDVVRIERVTNEGLATVYRLCV
jgi:DNA-directed RNA polymerase subunit H (RpoH/RPB5)